MRLEISGQTVKPIAIISVAGAAYTSVGRVAGSKFTDPERLWVTAGNQVTPLWIDDALIIALAGQARVPITIVVSLIYYSVGDSELHRQTGDARKIASVVNAFDKDQQVRVNALDGSGAAFRRCVPISA